MVARSWTYTLNHYDDEEIETLKLLECTRHRCGKEIGVEGTPHLQGIICFTKTYRLAGLKKILPRAHWEPTKSVEHALNYCAKGVVIIDKNTREQGKRNDIDDAIKTLKEQGIEAVKEDHPLVYLKYQQKLNSLLNMKPPPYREVEVILITGPPGTGKSRRAREIDPELYSVPLGHKVWFDGYVNEQTILLDDFEGEMTYTNLLRLLDVYPIQLEIKGGFVWNMYTRVIITSNKSPDAWYPHRDISALKRRITSTTIIS